MSRFPLRRSRDLWLSLEDFIRGFPRGFPPGLSHVPPLYESILGVKVEPGQEKRVPLEWTETSAGLLDLWQDPGVPLIFSVEIASS